MKAYTCQYSEGQWQLDAEDDLGPYQMPLLDVDNVNRMTEEAGEGQRWSLHYRKKGQRKDRLSSCACHSFIAHLDVVAMLLKEEDCVSVYLLGGPDLKIDFYK